MPSQYSPKRFFRQVPNHFLKQYFSERQILAEIDFDKLTETKVDPIYDAWLLLPDHIRNLTQQDFQDIDILSTEGGSKAILDEAKSNGEGLAETFAELKGFHEHSFWTFLERKIFWAGALAFHHADTVPLSYWRKRKNLPNKPASVDSESIRQFEQKLSDYFHKTQGRGKNCKIDCYRRHNLDYFFAYPEDYAQASMEWEEREFKRRPYHPAFEIIFVYSQQEGTLDTYISEDRKVVPHLQIIFANAILKAELDPDSKDERIYDLNPLKSRHFQFVYRPESGIADVLVKKLRFIIHNGKNERITLEADPTHNRHAVLDLLEQVTSHIPAGHVFITQVGLQVVFLNTPSSKRTNTRSFDISWPNSCSLKQDGRDLIIRKLLADSRLEPRLPTEKDEET